MDSKQLPFLNASELSVLIAGRQVSPVEVTVAYLDRIEALNPRLAAYITVCGQDALRAARRAERAVLRGNVGPLLGIPFGAKDQLYSRGVRTTAGSKILADHVPVEDATPIARMKAAGAILLGKHNMTQFAVGAGDAHAYGEPPNPWDMERSPGSSSSGSGVAVAASLCAVALGEDTGGSIRGPAASCGIVGMRPSWGLVSRYGTFPICWSMDTVGPMTRTVQDCALVLQTITGYDPRDRYTSRRRAPDYVIALDGGIKGIRIGVVRELNDMEDVHPEVRQAVARAASVLQGLGATVEECSIPSIVDATVAASIIFETDGAFVHGDWLRANPSSYGAGIRRRLLAASLIPSYAYHKATRLRALVRSQMESALQRFDVLACPVQRGPVPRLEPVVRTYNSKQEARGLFTLGRGSTAPSSLQGGPAISVPCGFTSDGLPIGLEVLGKPFDEPTVLRVAHAYEQATPWHKRRPPV